VSGGAIGVTLVVGCLGLGIGGGGVTAIVSYRPGGWMHSSLLPY